MNEPYGKRRERTSERKRELGKSQITRDKKWHFERVRERRREREMKKEMDRHNNMYKEKMMK